MAQVILREDIRLVGATAILNQSTTRLIVANPASMRLVVASRSGAPTSASSTVTMLGQSAALSARPYKLALNASYIFALGVDTLFRVANGVGIATDGFSVNEYEIECANPRWVLADSTYVFVPWGNGGISVYSAAGARLHRYGSVLDDIAAATRDSATGDLVLVSTDGVVRTVEVGAGGALSFRDEAEAPGIRDVRAVSVGDEYLAIGSRDRVSFMDYTEPEIPVFAGHAAVDGRVESIVLSGTDEWWIAADAVEDQDDNYQVPTQDAVFISGAGVYALSGTTGRICVEADFEPITPDDII